MSAGIMLSIMKGSLPQTEIISGIFGSISLAAWITVLVPQLHANYKSGKADGLSMTFLFIWLAGDSMNFIGTLLTRLAPTAIALAGYFCISDVILIGQCFYYKIHTESESLGGPVNSSEQRPLLQQPDQDHRNDPSNPNARLKMSPWLSNSLSLLAVCAVGCVGWLVSFQLGLWDTAEPDAQDVRPSSESIAQAIGIMLGYSSSICYLCARIPQIMKNYRERSCEGLAILFFLLSMMGNVTYFISLLTYSQERDYLLASIPWCLGSLGTVAEDLIIFAQFRKYSGSEQASLRA